MFVDRSMFAWKVIMIYQGQSEEFGRQLCVVSGGQDMERRGGYIFWVVGIGV